MSSFQRRRATRSPRKRFLIVCEGEKSEPNYVEGVRRNLKSDLIDVLVLGPCGGAKEVVERAASELKSSRKIFKKSGDPFDKFDYVWCVFDVDDHDKDGKLLEALKQASDNGIEVALSNPCYELWVILHYRDERKDVHRHVLQSECKAVYKRDDKHVPFEILWPNYDLAKERAANLRKWQIENDRRQGNPWTNFDELIEALIKGSGRSTGEVFAPMVKK